ncbi:MAG: NAD(P)-dependent oxidoreductase [Methylocella sp.]
MTAYSSGLIGFTGFVGGTLMRDRSFDAVYNSVNIADINGCSFERLICAGVSAAKWQANRDPKADRAAIARLTGPLLGAKSREFILISTIDVYPDPSRPDDEGSHIDPMANHAYGRHRYELESWAADHFETVRIVRLPALFGAGLKKNAVYDLMNNNQVDKINPLAIFQWYPLCRLADDLERISAEGLPLVNLFPEPVGIAEIIAHFFPEARPGPPLSPAPHYRLRTCHAPLFGGSDGYIMSASEVMGAFARFLDEECASIAPKKRNQ